MYNPKLSLIKNKAAKYNKLMKSLSLTDYVGTELGDGMLTFAISTVPQCVCLGLTTIIPFVVGSVLANCGLEFTTDELVIIIPLHTNIKEMVSEKEVETMLLT